MPSLRYNAAYFRELASRPLIAVVKDDAYGHGAAEVALSLHDIASSFAVSSVDEGVSLRLAGVQEDVLVLTPSMTAEEGARLLSYGLTACITSFPALSLLAKAAEGTGKVARGHLAVNTGMNRYGFSPEEAKSAAYAAKQRGIFVEGVYSHYFSAENEGYRRGQNTLFREAVKAVKDVFPDCISHIAATGGTLKGERSDAVRVGLGLYGYLPEGGSGPLRRAMKLYAYVSNSCKRIGEGLGYAPAERDCPSVHTLRCGYGDGFFREGMEGVIGNLCMDASLAEGEAEFGEKVCIVSDFEAYATAHGTSVYEALVRLPSKAVKQYIR